MVVNIIAESMYAQCNIDGNEYLLLESFVNNRKSDKALSVKYQTKVVKGKSTIRKLAAAWETCH